MATITLKSVEKSYQAGSYAVKGIDLEVNEGEFIVFVGPSGCGKSTLLRMVAGLETVTGGEIFINDRKVNDVSPAERDVAMVFQNYALYPHMSVYDNLAYGLKNRRVKKAEIQERVQKAAKMLQIDAFLDRKPNQLSGGQRQRVAMGRALARSPEVFLFDEPLSNLDAKLRMEMRIEIKRLQKQLGVTSIYVTHDQVEAMTLADRLVVINEGRIEQVGTPMEVYSNPANSFVASFIGIPNINMVAMDDAEACFNGAFEGSNVMSPSGDVLVGIRPEAVVPANDGNMRFMADVIEQHGAENVIYGRLLDQGGQTRVQNFCIRLSQAESPADGEVMPISVDPQKLMYFDGQSGDRLTA